LRWFKTVHAVLLNASLLNLKEVPISTAVKQDYLLFGTIEVLLWEKVSILTNTLAAKI
jgi:hypothetical protein